jgi:hypothetical protein
MPHHSYLDTLQLEYSPLKIFGKYTEIGWLMKLKSGTLMNHTARKVITV